MYDKVVKKFFMMFEAFFLCLLPCLSCYAYVYDCAEVRRAIEQPEEYSNVVNKEMINRFKGKTTDEALILTVINDDIKNGLINCVTKYEDNNVMIECEPFFTWQYLSRIEGCPDNAIVLYNLHSINNSVPYVFSKEPRDYKVVRRISSIGGLIFNIVNKTDKVMEIDFTNSYFGVLNRVQKIFDEDDDLRRSLNNKLLTPLVIAPKDSSTEYVHFSYGIGNAGKIDTRYSLVTESEILGRYNFLINKTNVPFTLSAMVDSTKLNFKYGN